MNQNGAGGAGGMVFFEDDRRYRGAALTLLVLALALSLLGLRRDIWLDEYLTLRAVSLPTLAAMLEDLRTDTSPPLYFILLRGWAAFSLHESWLRLFSILLYLATLVVILKWLKPVSRAGSLVAAAFLATFPLTLRYAVEIRMYGLLLLFTALAFWGAARLVREPRGVAGPLLLGGGLTGAMATHLVGIFLLLPCAAFLLKSVPGGSRLPWPRALPALALPAAMFLVFYVVYLKPEELQIWWMPRVSWTLFWGGVRHVITFLARVGPLEAVYAPHPLLAEALVISALGLVALLSVMFLAAGDWRRTHPFFLAGTLYFGQILAYSAFFIPVLWDRTLLPLLVPVAGFVGLQAVTLRRGWLTQAFAAVSLTGALAFSLTWIFYWSPHHTEENRRLAQVLASQWRPGDQVVVYPSWAAGPVLHYFPTLPPEALVMVKPGEEGPSLRETLAHTGIGREGASRPRRLFLLVRLDTLLAQKMGALRELLASLPRQAPTPATLQVFLGFDAHITLHPGLVAARDEILAELAARFGPPLHFQKSAAFYWLVYKVPLVGPPATGYHGRRHPGG
jgi:hypothetical protein